MVNVIDREANAKPYAVPRERRLLRYINKVRYSVIILGSYTRTFIDSSSLNNMIVRERLRPLLRSCSSSIRPSINICPFCLFPSFPPQTASLPRLQRVRKTSTLSSSTAIHATKDIPPALLELHEALDVLRRDAAGYVNLSRLQLALRGLESRTPTVRIAGLLPRLAEFLQTIGLTMRISAGSARLSIRWPAGKAACCRSAECRGRVGDQVGAIGQH